MSSLILNSLHILHDKETTINKLKSEWFAHLLPKQGINNTFNWYCFLTLPGMNEY